MESVSRAEAALLGLPWVTVNVGGSELLAKAWFGDTEYRVVLSDLTNVWEEEMDADGIQRRTQELNKRLRAPVRAFFSHLCSVARPCLSGTGQDHDGASHFFLERHGNQLTVRLKSELAGVPFHWEFRCAPAPVAQVCKQLVRPLLAISRVLQRQVGELGALLVKKDYEIQDYRENGAVLSRSRLQTEPFEEERYKENFMAQTLPQMAALQDGLGFDPGLQELYVAVGAHGNARKRRRSVEAEPGADEDSSVPEPDPAACHPAAGSPSDEGPVQSAGRQQARPRGASGDPQEPDSEQTVPLIPAPAPVLDQPSAPRPKKKKASGLFR